MPVRCRYPSVGHLNEDVVNFFAQGISIHSHAAWGQTSDEWQLLASEMARRSRRMQEYWHALIVEYFHNVKGLGECYAWHFRAYASPPGDPQLLLHVLFSLSSR